jgi:hypothetical protein
MASNTKRSMVNLKGEESPAADYGEIHVIREDTRQCT